MNIEQVKELLAAASGEHDGSSCYCYNEGWGKNRCRVGPAEKRLAALAPALADSLVESQAALKTLTPTHVSDGCNACVALRLEKLEMKEE